MNESLEQQRKFLISVHDMFEDHKKEEASVNLLLKEMSTVATDRNKRDNLTELSNFESKKIFYNFLANTIARKVFPSSCQSYSSCSTVSSSTSRNMNTPNPHPEQNNSDGDSSLSSEDMKKEYVMKELSNARSFVSNATKSLQLLKAICFEDQNNQKSLDETHSWDEQSLTSSR